MGALARPRKMHSPAAGAGKFRKELIIKIEARQRRPVIQAGDRALSAGKAGGGVEPDRSASMDRQCSVGIAEGDLLCRLAGN